MKLIYSLNTKKNSDQVYKESDFELFSQNEENIEASEVFYNESIKNFLTHIFVFDEYVDILKTIKVSY